MPILKHWHGLYIDVPYYKLVFKNDLIMHANRRNYTVKHLRLNIDYEFKNDSWIKQCKVYVHVNEQLDYIPSHIELNDDFYLVRRPFINWVRYFLVLLFKSYEGVTHKWHCVTATDKNGFRETIFASFSSRKLAKAHLKKYREINEVHGMKDFKIERYPVKK